MSQELCSSECLNDVFQCVNISQNMSEEERNFVPDYDGILNMLASSKIPQNMSEEERNFVPDDDGILNMLASSKIPQNMSEEERNFVPDYDGILNMLASSKIPQNMSEEERNFVPDFEGILNMLPSPKIAQNMAEEEGDFVPDFEGILNMLPSPKISQVGYGNEEEETGGSSSSSVKFLGESQKFYRVFNMYGRSINFSFEDVANQKNPFSWIQNGVNEVLSYGLRDVHCEDYVGVVLTNINLPERPVAISFRKKNMLTTDVVMDVIGKVLQSNEDFFSKDLLRLRIDSVRMPVGGGRSKRRQYRNHVDFARRNRGILVIKNTDNNCLAYALALGIEYRHDPNSFNFVTIKNGNSLLLKTKAIELCQNAGVDLNAGGSIQEIKLFQDFLMDFQIVVYNGRTGREILFEGPGRGLRPTLNILFEDNHYNLITSLTAAFCVSYYCENCRVGTNDKNRHACPFICPCCHMCPPCVGEANIKCFTCLRNFRGQICFDEHKKSLCSRLQRCKICLASLWVNRKNAQSHVCFMSYCTICNKSQPHNHKCYMPVIKDRNETPTQGESSKQNKQKKLPHLFIFYDFESTQDKEVYTVGFEHEVNLCVAQQACLSCINFMDLSTDCEICGKRQHIFTSSTIVRDFLNYIATLQEKFDIIALAHNMRGYDGCFILNEIMKNPGRFRPSIIRNGCKLMSIRCGKNIRFLDSLNYMPLPLSKLPSTFKFEGVKGYFPHFFNTSDNKNYVGPLPDISFYGCNQMSSGERDKFLKWYNDQTKNNVVFNLASEIVTYCISDVDILRKACIKFRECLLKLTSVDPFLEATTIASACNTVFRKLFLKEESIGIIPKNGYRLRENYSKISLQWLSWLEFSLNKNIRHAANGREHVLDGTNIRVDGFCAATKTVYQFHGCYWHGCTKCFPDQTIIFSQKSFKNKNQSKVMSLRQEHTVGTDKRIRDLGYNLVVMWECEFNILLNQNLEIKRFLDENYNPSLDPLNPRDAFFGGRTNVIKLYHQVKEEEGEKIHYFDVCSLYPYVNKYGTYPVKHPKIHIGELNCRPKFDARVNGLIKCSILPPQNLLHPLLPYKFDGKLTFPLCKTCLESRIQEDCPHSPEERNFTGTYVADEIYKAVSLGYQVLEVFEIWEYEVSKYDPETMTGGLFTEYVNTFLKIKQECSGWPSWCKTDDDKENYISEYLKKEGISLSKDEIYNNAGLRYLSKLMLNSFWGKFGQRENLMQTAIITQPSDLYKLLLDPSFEVHNVTVINDNTVLATYDSVEEAIVPLKSVNVAIAAYTTATARLKLYSYLEKLQERVLYFDTDSVIFTSKPGEWMPPTGDFLGELTDELVDYGEGSYISEFVSGGPKNYAFKVKSGDFEKTVCKVKGISLNYQNSQLINFDSVKNIICNDAPNLTVTNDRKIMRTSDYRVISRKENKIYRACVSKRRRIDNYITLPFGFVSK